jgi:hypothetical protein
LTKNKLEKKEFSVLMITFFFIITISVLKFDLKFFPYGKDAEVIEEMRKSEGLIISSLGVQGFENFNILSYSGRPHYIAGQQLIKFKHENEEIIIDVYCNSIFANVYSQKLEEQKKCFSERTPELWNFIGSQLGVTSVVVNKKITTKLSLVAESPNFKLYHIDL